MDEVQLFSSLPNMLNVASVVLGEWETYHGGRSTEDTLEAVMKVHKEHIGKLRARGEFTGSLAGIVITPIPDTDMAIIDVDFPTLNERFIGILSRKGADQIMLTITGSAEVTGIDFSPLQTQPTYVN